MRTTRKQIEAMAAQVSKLSGETLGVSYAPEYGGYALTYEVADNHGGHGIDYLGGGMMDANRIPAGDFYRALRLARDLLERMQAR